MRVENKNSNRVNFTSVVPVRVIIDGDISLRESNIRRAIRGVQSILINPANKNDRFVKIKKEFSSKVKDLNYYGEKVKIGEVIRNYVDSTKAIGYIFTGVHVETLNALGKLIGPEKHWASKIRGKARSFESKSAAWDYFDKVEEFIMHAKSRVSEKINPKTMSYEGDELVLNVYVKSVGKPGKKGYKFEIDHVEFKKAENLPQLPIKEKKTAKPKVIKPKQIEEKQPIEQKVQEVVTESKRFSDRYNPKTRKKPHEVQKTLF